MRLRYLSRRIIIGCPKSGKSMTLLKEIAKLRAKQLVRNPFKRFCLYKTILKALLESEVY